MKVRVKFSKTGAMKFIGHLDMMRYFQKALRRAEIDVAFTGGYSPHMILSFAAPIGVGVESYGEYFDIELNSWDSSKEMMERLNKAMVEGVEILSIVQVPDDKASKAMSLVAAADYHVNFREGYVPCEDWQERFLSFMQQPQITITKKTKKSEQEIDIKPLVHSYHIDDNKIFMKVSTGSSMNLKPDLVLEAFFHYLKKEWNPLAIMVTRLEVYAETESGLASLESLGDNIE